MTITTDTKEDWGCLLDATISTAKGIEMPHLKALANKLLKAQATQWLNWKPTEAELNRLEIIKRSIELLRNPTPNIQYLQAKNDIAVACKGKNFPWPQILIGIQSFLNSVSTKPTPSKPITYQNQSLKPTIPATGLSISLPDDPKNIWLAIGDETGDWDYESAKRSKRGLVLIIGRLDVWQKAFNEQINGQTVANRMRQPLQHLPPDAKKSTFHHAIDAFSLGYMPPELRQELKQNLAWLAQHPALITLGFDASSSDLYQRLTHSQDASQALAKGYAALLAYVMPFLDKKDVLLLGFEGRSENPDTIAARRSEVFGDLNDQERAVMDMRGFLSTLRHTLVDQLKQHWAHEADWDKRFDLATLSVLVKDKTLNSLCPLSKQPDNAWKGLADLGASLLQVRNNNLAEHFVFEQNPNVLFLKLPELLS